MDPDACGLTTGHNDHDDGFHRERWSKERRRVRRVRAGRRGFPAPLVFVRFRIFVPFVLQKKSERQ
jgi:hypothetical protein